MVVTGESAAHPSNSSCIPPCVNQTCIDRRPRVAEGPFGQLDDGRVYLFKPRAESSRVLSELKMSAHDRDQPADPRPQVTPGSQDVCHVLTPRERRVDHHRVERAERLPIIRLEKIAFVYLKPRIRVLKIKQDIDVVGIDLHCVDTL